MTTRKIISSAASLAVLGSLLTAAPTARAEYEYQLIDYPGSTSTRISGISGAGNAVGHAYIDSDFYPFTYSINNDKFNNLSTPVDYSFVEYLGINVKGTVVGSGRGADNISVGVIRDTDGSFTLVQHPDAVFGTVFRGINNQGLVTGYYNDAAYFQNSFIYDSENENFIDIDVPAGFNSFPHGINSKGEAVGSHSFGSFYTPPGEIPYDPCPDFVKIGSVPNQSGRYGWLRSNDGSVTYFQINGGFTSPRGIGKSGAIVGQINGSGFVVELDGTPCQAITLADSELLNVPGASITFPYGISNAGRVAGLAAGFEDGSLRGFVAIFSDDDDSSSDE